MNSLFSIAYLPNTTWFYYLLNSDSVTIERNEFYLKQTYRNRCQILTANGKLDLTIPLTKLSAKEIITEKKISYSENWQIKHWRAITSAYKNSPYFEFFEDEFRPFYAEKHELLFEYNLRLIQTVLRILRLKIPIELSKEYITNFEGNDLRNNIHPKLVPELSLPPYNQVFSEKLSFVPNLSVIDILFNKGLDTKVILSRQI